MSDSSRFAEDDISLRDIYLLIRKHWLVIVFLPLVLAILAFVVSSFLPKSYEAESVALVTPSPIRLSGNANLSYRPPIEVSYEAYETLANSKGVLDQAIERAGLDVKGFNGKVSQLVGPQRPDQVVPLLAAHTVTYGDPEEAAKLANAWAEVTLETTQKSLLTNLDPLIVQTTEEAKRVRENLATAEKDLEAFETRDNSQSLQATLDQITQLIANADNGRVTISELKQQNLDLNVALLLNQVSQNQDNQSQMATKLANSSLNLSQEIAANDAFIATLETQALSAELQDELDYRRSLAASLAARQELLAEQLTTYQQKQTDLQAQLAGLKRERAELERALELAQTAYDSIVTLEPSLDFLTKVTPSSTQLLNVASVPTEPSGPNPLLNAAIVLLLSGLLVLIFVFLREAIS
ncbi:MAG: hypothetical protein KC422_14490 [Trueperaceae bacterium]|nr:hypothetical protein [Trueperaceae bacterium]